MVSHPHYTQPPPLTRTNATMTWHRTQASNTRRVYVDQWGQVWWRDNRAQWHRLDTVAADVVTFDK